MELKSRGSSTGWSYKDAEEQYKMIEIQETHYLVFKKCLAHFAVDENFYYIYNKTRWKEYTIHAV